MSTKPYKLFFYSSVAEFEKKTSEGKFDAEFATIDEAEKALFDSKRTASVVRPTYRVISTNLAAEIKSDLSNVPAELKSIFQFKFTDQETPCECPVCRGKFKDIEEFASAIANTYGGATKH